MPYAAITYRVKTGYEEEIAEIFGRFRQMPDPTLSRDDGSTAGKLLGTAVFIKDEFVVRVIHYEGDFAEVGKKVGAQAGTHLVEEELAPYLAEQRDTTTPEGFRAYFRNAVMRCISHLPPLTAGTGR
ncbi:SchA/CurD-like domain-containing protein [Amycolatopsis ultiminotia]|uniref:SchA/CurD-like domain-containing protein n=1 Tax=Amycolatopsis ultiminotia TaxID=543629 RepID=A0ABP6YKI8_9PSEU